MPMRSRFAFVLVLVVIIVASGWAIYRAVNQRDVELVAPPIRSQEEMSALWIQGVQETLASYDREQNATKARDALLALSVRADDQESHLALVLAFQGLIDARGGAASSLEKARQDFYAALKN